MMLLAVFRTIILYIVIIVLMRFMGKRQLAQMETSEFVVAIMISELAALPMQDMDLTIWHGIIPMATIASLEMLSSFITMKSIKARALICGKAAILINNGVLDRKEMKKNRVTIDELIEALRKNDITDLSTVQYAILEANGGISNILYPQYRPYTLGNAGQTAENTGMPIVVINDGRWLDSNLTIARKTRGDILKEIKSRGYKDEHEVFLAAVDEIGHVYVAK